MTEQSDLTSVVITPGMVLIDSMGGRWWTAPEYQERDVNRPGWLMLERVDGSEKLGYHEVLNRYGFTDGRTGDNEPYLIARLIGRDTVSE